MERFLVDAARLTQMISETSVIERTSIAMENGKIISHDKDGEIELSPDTPTSMNFWGFHPDIYPSRKPCLKNL